MNTKSDLFAESAITVFSEHGIKHGTMAQIARQAGVSRQTLYTVYSSKSDILVAAIAHDAQRRRTATLLAWRDDVTLAEKIDSFIIHDIIPYFRNLFTTLTEATSEGLIDVQLQMDGVRDARTSIIADTLKDSETHLALHGHSPRSYADFIIRCADGLMREARDEIQLKSLLGTLKSTVLSVLGQGSIATRRHTVPNK